MQIKSTSKPINSCRKSMSFLRDVKKGFDSCVFSSCVPLIRRLDTTHSLTQSCCVFSSSHASFLARVRLLFDWKRQLLRLLDTFLRTQRWTYAFPRHRLSLEIIAIGTRLREIMNQSIMTIASERDTTEWMNHHHRIKSANTFRDPDLCAGRETWHHGVFLSTWYFDWQTTVAKEKKNACDKRDFGGQLFLVCGCPRVRTWFEFLTGLAVIKG